MDQLQLTSFKPVTPTYRVATSTTGSTPVLITPIRPNPGGKRVNQYYIVNASAGFLFFTLRAGDASTAAALPAAASNAVGMVLPPNSAGTFTGPENAYFSGDLDAGTGDAYICGGEGL